MSEAMVASAQIALLTHAPNDLTVLQSALAQLPQEFPAVAGVNLQALESETQMAALLTHELADAQIIILRVLGRLGSVPGFAELLRSLISDFDIVIIDTPAASDHAEVQVIAAGAAAALILARKNHSSVPEMIKLTDSLRQTGTTSVGAVMNDF